MKVYTGSAWVAAYVSGAGYLAASNNLSDVADAPTSIANLGGLPTAGGTMTGDINYGDSITRPSLVLAVTCRFITMAVIVG